MSYKNSFNKLRITALAAFFSFANPASADTNSTAPNTETQNAHFYFSDTVNNAYGNQLRFIQKHTPGLSALILSTDDYNIPITEEERGTLEYIKANGEEFATDSPPHNQAKQKLRNTNESIINQIRGYSANSTPMLPQTALEYITGKNPAEFNSMLSGVASNVLSGTMETLSLAGFFKDTPDLNFAIVTVPASKQFNNVSFFTESTSGLSSELIENIKSTASDFRWVFFGHELAGHAFHKDVRTPPDTNNEIIDTRYTDEAVKLESREDIAGVIIFEKAKEQNLTSGADTTAEYAALRALGIFYKSLGISSCSDINQINPHYTTVLLNPKLPDFSSKLDLSKTPALSMLPPLINRVADAISGFIAAQDLKKEMQHNPNAFSAEQRLFFKSLPSDQSAFLEHLDDFAILGESIRTGTVIGDSFKTVKANPQYHYAALAFIKEHNLLAKVKSELGTDYALIIDDLFQDFLDAAEKYAPKLQNLDLSAKMDKRINPSLFGALDYDVFIDEFTAERLSQAPLRHQPQELGLN